MNKYQIEINNREILAKNPNTKIEILEKLAFDAEPKVKKAVALRSDLPIDLIEKMAADRQIIAKKFLLRNKSFSESLLSTLAQSSEPKALQMVALHPNTPISLLEKLATVPSAKFFVAQNPNVTIQILEQLAESDDKEVQLALAKNHKTNSDILTKLAFKSKESKILIPIIENKNTPNKIKSQILEKLSIISNFAIYKYIANNPYTPKNILIDWSKSQKFYKLHPLIAKNTNTPVIALDILSKKFCSREVLSSLVQNCNISKEILEYLYKKYLDDYFYSGLLMGMKNNPNTPNYIKEDIINNSLDIFSLAKKSNVYSDILLRKLKSNDHDDCYLLRDYDLSVKVSEYLLGRLSKSYQIIEREFVALHPKTPTEILEKLTHDQDMGVRDAAKYRLEKRIKDKEI